MIPIHGCCMPNRNQPEQWCFSFIRCDLLQQMRLFLPLEHFWNTHIYGAGRKREVRQCYWKVSKLTKDRRLKGFGASYRLQGLVNPERRSQELIWDDLVLPVVKGCTRRLPVSSVPPSSTQQACIQFSFCLSFLRLCFSPPTQPLISYQEV